MDNVTVDIYRNYESEDAYVENDQGKPWWNIALKSFNNEEENKKVAEQLKSRVKYLETKSYRLFEAIKEYQCYYNADRHITTVYDGAIKTMSVNLLRIGVNAIHSMIGREMPTINFMTNRAHYPLRHDISLLNDYIQAEFEHSNLYANVREAVRDAACSNLGIVKVYIDDDQKFVSERVPPRNILVNDDDQLYRDKKETFERRVVSKYTLLEMLPNLKPWQKEAIKADSRGLLPCYEGYYKNKVKVIFVDGAILHAEPWLDVPPYFCWRWTEKTNSFWGKGICEEGLPMQINYDKVIDKAVKSMDLFSNNKIIVTGSGRFTAQEISSQVEMLRYHGSGVGPENLQFVTPPVINPQYFTLLQTFEKDFFLTTSLSQLTASGQKEKGVYSAAAAQAVHDIQQSRFAATSQNLVDMYVAIARYMVREASRVFDNVGDGTGTSLKTKIRWNEIDLENNYHLINEAPMSRLSKDPAARQMQLMQQQAMGWITPQQALERFDDKDFKGSMDTITSSVKWVNRTLSEIMQGEVRYPSPNIDYNLQLDTAVKFLNMNLNDGLDEDSEEAQGLENFVYECNLKVQEQIQAAKLEHQETVMAAAPKHVMRPKEG